MSTTYKGTTSDGLGVQSTPAFAATQMQQRTIWDKIKLNYARNLKLIALIADGAVGEGGLTKKAGLISKWEVQTPRFEAYNFTPFDVSVVATADLNVNGTTLSVPTANLTTYRTLINTSNGTMCRIDSITAGGVACEVTSVGDTTFAVTSGDTLVIAATAYPENSSAPAILSKDFDNVYNLLQIVRRPVAISNTMLKSKFHATNDYFKLLKEINMIDMMEEVERTFILGQRAAGAVNTTAGGSALSTAFRTTRGLMNWKGSTYDMKGSMTPYKLRTEIPQIMTTVREDQTITALCGYKAEGAINEMFNAQALYTVSDEKSALQTYGVRTTKVRTNNAPIELVKHKIFDQGEYANSMLLFVPDNVFFAYLKDRDIRPVVGIQNNDLDGMIDSVEAECGCGVVDGGASVLLVKNIF